MADDGGAVESSVHVSTFTTSTTSALTSAADRSLSTPVEMSLKPVMWVVLASVALIAMSDVLAAAVDQRITFAGTCPPLDDTVRYCRLVGMLVLDARPVMPVAALMTVSTLAVLRSLKPVTWVVFAR